MVKRRIILRAVGKPPRHVAHRPDSVFLRLIFHKRPHRGFYLRNALRRIEHGRLVHVVPKTFNTLVRQYFVFVPEPAARIIVQHIRQVGIPRPYGNGKFTPVLFFAEIAVFHAFLINRIALFHLHARINDGYKPDIPCLHLPHKRPEIREIFRIPCKILVVFHIVNVHINHVQRDMVFAVAICNRPEILRRTVAPPALPVAESKFRRNITPSDEFTELFNNVISICTLYHINRQIRICTGNFHHPAVRISNVEAESAGVIEKQPEACFSRNCNKVMRTVKRGFVLRMVRVVRAVADIDIATLIDAAVCLPQPENHVLLRKRITETKALRKACFAKLRRTCRFLQGNDCRLRFHRSAVNVFLHHSYRLQFKIFLSFLRVIFSYMVSHFCASARCSSVF